MVKEFCVNYELHESSEYTNRKVYDVKVKTNEDILSQEVEIDDIDGYKKALKALGYKERLYEEELKEEANEYKEKIYSLEEEIRNLTFLLKTYKNMEKSTNNLLNIGSEYFCDWW